jgi:hypothetical protein
MQVSCCDPVNKASPVGKYAGDDSEANKLFSALAKSIEKLPTFKEADSNANGSLSSKELELALFDTNGDGKMSKQESSARDTALKDAGFKDMDELYEQLDKNSDGKINKSEWNAILQLLNGDDSEPASGRSSSGGGGGGGGGSSRAGGRPASSGGGGSGRADDKPASSGGGGSGRADDKPASSGGGGSGRADDKPASSGGGGSGRADDKPAPSGGGGSGRPDDKPPTTSGGGMASSGSKPIDAGGFTGGVQQTPGGKQSGITGTKPGQKRHQTGLSGYEAKGNAESFTAQPGGQLSGTSNSARSEAYFSGNTSGKSFGANYQVTNGDNVTIMQQFNSSGGAPSMRVSVVDDTKIVVATGDGSPDTIANIKPGQQFRLEVKDLGNGQNTVEAFDTSGKSLGQITVDNTRSPGENNAFRYGCYLQEGASKTQVIVSDVKTDLNSPKSA